MTRTFRADECTVCGTGKSDIMPKQELIIEELCGRNRGKRTFSITPTKKFEIDYNKISILAQSLDLRVDNQGDLAPFVKITIFEQKNHSEINQT